MLELSNRLWPLSKSGPWNNLKAFIQHLFPSSYCISHWSCASQTLQDSGLKSLFFTSNPMWIDTFVKMSQEYQIPINVSKCLLSISIFFLSHTSYKQVGNPHFEYHYFLRTQSWKNLDSAWKIHTVMSRQK